MDLIPFFKSVLEQDRAPIVLCDLNHTIIYLNQAAIERYAYNGGAELIGKSLMLCHNQESCKWIEKVISWFAAKENHNMIFESHNKKENKDLYMVALRDDDGNLIGYYEKHEYRTKETSDFYDFTE